MNLPVRVHGLTLASLLIAGMSIMTACGEDGAEPSEEALGPIPEAVFSTSLPDIQRSKQRLADSIYGQLWQLPAFAQGRSEWQDMLAEFTAETGVDGNQVWQHVAASEWRMLGLKMADGLPQEPAMTGWVDLGQAIDPVWDYVRSELPVADATKGVEGALALPDSEHLVMRSDNRLLVAADNASLLRETRDQGRFDLRFTWNRSHIDALLAQLDLGEDERLLIDSAYGAIGDGQLLVEILPNGTREIALVQGRDLLRGSQPLDTAVLDRIPANALMVMASGMDGEESAAYLREIMEDLQQADPDMAEFNPLAQFPIAEILAELNGTMTIAVLPPPMGAPFPGIAVHIPFNDTLAAELQPFLSMLEVELPVAGQDSRIPLPLPMPLPLVVARDKESLLITTIPDHATAWLAGESGGFVQASAYRQAMAQHQHGELFGLGVSDTPRVITLLRNSFDSFGAMMPGDAQAMAQPVLDIFSQFEGQGYYLISGKDDTLRWESKGLLGGVMVPVFAGLTLPAITSARARARQMENTNNLKMISMTLFQHAEEYGIHPRPPEGVPMPEDPRAVTAAIFEHLAHSQELPYGLFRNQDSPLDQAPRADVEDIWRNPHLDWAHSYAMDWSAPVTAPGVRIVLAARYPINGSISVAYGDYSAGTIPVAAINADGSAASAFNSRVFEENDIFHRDEGENWDEIGRGPRQKSWVR